MLTIREVAERGVICYELASPVVNGMQFVVSGKPLMSRLYFAEDTGILLLDSLVAPLALEATRVGRQSATFELGGCWLTLWWKDGINYKSPEARERWTGV